MWKASVQLKAKLNVAAAVHCEKVRVSLWGLVGVGDAFFPSHFLLRVELHSKQTYY